MIRKFDDPKPKWSSRERASCREFDMAVSNMSMSNGYFIRRISYIKCESTENRYFFFHFLLSFFLLFINLIRSFFLRLPFSGLPFDCNAFARLSSGFCESDRLFVSDGTLRLNEENSVAKRDVPLKAARPLSYSALSRFNLLFSFSNRAISFSSCAIRLSFSVVFFIFL